MQYLLPLNLTYPQQSVLITRGQVLGTLQNKLVEVELDRGRHFLPYYGAMDLIRVIEQWRSEDFEFSVLTTFEANQVAKDVGKMFMHYNPCKYGSIACVYGAIYPIAISVAELILSYDYVTIKRYGQYKLTMPHNVSGRIVKACIYYLQNQWALHLETIDVPSVPLYATATTITMRAVMPQPMQLPDLQQVVPEENLPEIDASQCESFDPSTEYYSQPIMLEIDPN